MHRSPRRDRQQPGAHAAGRGGVPVAEHGRADSTLITDLSVSSSINGFPAVGDQRRTTRGAAAPPCPSKCRRSTFAARVRAAVDGIFAGAVVEADRGNLFDRVLMAGCACRRIIMRTPMMSRSMSRQSEHMLKSTSGFAAGSAEVSRTSPVE